MILLEYGNTKVWPEWFVTEQTPPFFMRMYHVRAGEVTCFCGDKRLELKPERLYLFPTTVPYRLVQQPKNPLVCTFLHVIVSPMLMPDVIEIDPNESLLLPKLLEALRLAIDEECQDVLEPIADALIAYCKRRGCFTTVSPEVSVALQWIAQHKSYMPTIEELSHTCGYQPQYFIRKFCREVGMTPHQFILHYHLREAAYLLRCGTSISAAVNQTGFADVKNFEKVFRQKYHMTPTQYKNSNQVMP